MISVIEQASLTHILTDYLHPNRYSKPNTHFVPEQAQTATLTTHADWQSIGQASMRATSGAVQCCRPSLRAAGRPMGGRLITLSLVSVQVFKISAVA